jgi:Tol biopolymer transport system component
VRNAGGGGGEQLLASTGNWIFPDSWSKDGRFILFEESNPKTNYDLWVLPVSKNAKPYPLLNAPYMENHGAFSPDGKYFAYSSEETGRSEIFVQTFPDVTQGKWQISASGGLWPVWSNDGKELFYVSLEKKMMGVDTSGGFQSTTAKVLFSNFPRRINPTDGYSYAVSPDAQRFVIITPVEDPSRAFITIISNWQQLLKK